MTPIGALVAVAVAAGIGVALIPDGALARLAVRRGRHAQSGPRPRPRSGSEVAGRAARRSWVPPVLVRMLEVGGRVVRTWARRGPDPAADLRLGSALGAAVVVAVLISPVLALPVAGGIWAVPSLRARTRSRLEERRIRGAVPDVVDLFRLAVGAGLSLHQAVDVVAVRAPAPVGAALEEVRRRVGLGARLGDAFDALDHLGDPVHPLAAALRGSARYGAPLGAALERVAVDARVLRRRRAEEDARRLPVQLLFPLVICILPAFGLLAVVPLLLASLRSLQL